MEQDEQTQQELNQDVLKNVAGGMSQQDAAMIGGITGIVGLATVVGVGWAVSRGKVLGRAASATHAIPNAPTIACNTSIPRNPTYPANSV